MIFWLLLLSFSFAVNKCCIQKQKSEFLKIQFDDKKTFALYWMASRQVSISQSPCFLDKNDAIQVDYWNFNGHFSRLIFHVNHHWWRFLSHLKNLQKMQLNPCYLDTLYTFLIRFLKTLTDKIFLKVRKKIIQEHKQAREMENNRWY